MYAHLLKEHRSMSSLRNDSGTYLLVIHLAKRQTITIGGRGPIAFRRGYYVYVGSALKNLSSRIARHQRKEKTLFWHIDYLLQKARLVAVYEIRRPERLECRLARALRLGAVSEVAHFGASDCACRSHLFYYPRRPDRSSDFLSAFSRAGQGRI